MEMVCKSLDVSRPRGKDDEFMEDRRSLVDHPRQPPLASGDSMLSEQSERRRIVAQVRRKDPKYLDFFASQNSSPSCDNLLTKSVDRPDRVGL